MSKPLRRTGRRRIPSFLRHVGSGVVTGAADDDPSGIATYTQAGASSVLGCCDKAGPEGGPSGEAGHD